MPIRSLAELNQMFRDTAVDEEITPAHHRDVWLSQMVHGNIGSAAKAQITLPTGFTPLDFDVERLGRGVTLDGVNKWITDIPVTMKVEVALEVSFMGANNTTYEFGVFKDSGSGFQPLPGLQDEERLVNAAMRGHISISDRLQLEPGDKIQAGVRANGAIFTLLRGGLSLQRVVIE